MVDENPQSQNTIELNGSTPPLSQDFYSAAALATRVETREAISGRSESAS
jgi:hypothetical protein